VLILILACLNVRIAGNGVMPHFSGEFKDQNASNITVHINMNTTDTLHSVAKTIARLIPPDWKLNRANLAPYL